jgi:hypothetical protein
LDTLQAFICCLHKLPLRQISVFKKELGTFFWIEQVTIQSAILWIGGDIKIWLKLELTLREYLEKVGKVKEKQCRIRGQEPAHSSQDSAVNIVA